MPGILLWFVPATASTRCRRCSTTSSSTTTSSDRPGAGRPHLPRCHGRAGGPALLRRWLMWAAVSMAPWCGTSRWTLLPIVAWLLAFGAARLPADAPVRGVAGVGLRNAGRIPWWLALVWRSSGRRCWPRCGGGATRRRDQRLRRVPVCVRWRRSCSPSASTWSGVGAAAFDTRKGRHRRPASRLRRRRRSARRPVGDAHERAASSEQLMSTSRPVPAVAAGRDLLHGRLRAVELMTAMTRLAREAR